MTRHNHRVNGVKAVLMGGLWLAAAPVAGADVKASRACRGTLAKEFGQVVQTGLEALDACHQRKLAGAAAIGPCNVTTGADLDPRGTYRKRKDRARAAIGTRCPAGDPVLGNYPGGDPAGVLLAIDAGLPGNAVLAQGNGGTGSDKATRRCLAAIGRARARIVADILKSSSSCQRGRDKRAVTFGPLDDPCVGTGRTAMAKATTSIRRLCTGVGAPGACTPLPECATDAARRLGQGLARSVYGTAAGEPVCGNGTVEGPEQCDDSNTVAGDGCSARCEAEARSCGAAIGTRAVRVSVSTPEPLAALRIDLDYPQYAAGVTGTAQSGLVQGQVSVLQGTATAVAMLANDRDSDLTVLLGSARGFIATGALLDVTMDSCVPQGENICNRNQNVFGCCPGGDVGNCFANPPACTIFDTTVANAGTPAGCCPADNACAPQAVATSCSVSTPIGETGQAVEGVTCSVTVSGS